MSILCHFAQSILNFYTFQYLILRDVGEVLSLSVVLAIDADVVLSMDVSKYTI